MEFTGLVEQFRELNAEIAGVSHDSQESHRKFIEKQGLKIILLSDVEKKTLKDYGVWQKKQMAGKEYMGVVRSTCIIDPNGTIAFTWKDVKAAGHAAEVLAKLKELV